MKIAYLISVYKDAEQLKRLVDSLKQENTWIYIHIDRKINISPFMKILPESKNIRYIRTRIFTQWGGYSQVLYQKALLEETIASNIDFDRIFIMTGQDYPLLSNEQLEKELLKHPSKEYIQGLNISELDKSKKLRNKLVLYHFLRDLKIKNYTLKKCFSGSARIIMKLLPIRKKPYLVLKNGDKWSVYQSSSYMCITFELSKYILQQMKENSQLMNYFKYSFVPEEMVIPTIVFNSKFRNNAFIYPFRKYEGLQRLAMTHHFEYGKSIKIYTISDYDELINCGKMFVRKLETGTSDTLMDKIDEYRKSH